MTALLLTLAALASIWLFAVTQLVPMWRDDARLSVRYEGHFDLVQAEHFARRIPFLVRKRYLAEARVARRRAA
jgi:hypothetical protein